MFKYYRSQNVLTLLQCSDEDLRLDDRKIGLFCDILTGDRVVKWSEETGWVNCVYDWYQDDEGETTTSADSVESGSASSETRKNVFRKERLHRKLEFDFIDYISNIKSNTFLDSAQSWDVAKPTKIEEVKSIMFNVQLGPSAGAVLGAFWKTLENSFVDNMESSFLHRRTLIAQQNAFVVSTDDRLDRMLNAPNADGLALINRFQHDLFLAFTDACTPPGSAGPILSALADATVALERLTNRKIAECRRFVESESIKRFLDRQLSSMITIYKSILQTEVR